MSSDNGIQVISLKQLPIIEERLQSIKAEIEKKTDAAMSLAVTEETRKDVKKVRAELNKTFGELETQRKRVKAAIMQPYAEFEAVYRECVTEPFEEADDVLGTRLADVEGRLKDEKEEEVKLFAEEFAKSMHVEWLDFKRLGMKVTLSATANSLKAQVSSKIAAVSRDCLAIAEMPNSDEIMVEYKSRLNLGAACQAVQQRHRELEAQRKADAERKAKIEAEREAMKTTEKAIAAQKALQEPAPTIQPPVKVDPAPEVKPPVQAAPAPQEKTYRTGFWATGTIEQLKGLKAYMEKEGIRYEPI